MEYNLSKVGLPIVHCFNFWLSPENINADGHAYLRKLRHFLYQYILFIFCWYIICKTIRDLDDVMGQKLTNTIQLIQSALLQNSIYVVKHKHFCNDSRHAYWPSADIIDVKCDNIKKTVTCTDAHVLFTLWYDAISLFYL